MSTACLLYVDCVSTARLLHVHCMSTACLLHVCGMSSACPCVYCMSFACLLHVHICPASTACLLLVYGMSTSALCLLHVYFMSTARLPNVYFMSTTCTGPLWTTNNDGWLMKQSTFHAVQTDHMRLVFLFIQYLVWSQVWLITHPWLEHTQL